MATALIMLIGFPALVDDPVTYGAIQFNADTAGPPLTSVLELLTHPGAHDHETVRLRGNVTQPELHLDETTLYIDFVFLLRDGASHVTVFGRHDRTVGDIQIETGRTVEVVGIYWQEKTLHNSVLKNVVEAISVNFFPGLNPDRA